MSSEAISIQDAIAKSAAKLAAVSDSARLDAELLLALAIDMPRSYLFAHPEEELDAAAVQRLDAMLARRLCGEPLAYITGVREFWSLQLMVSPATLVPRPETERLVEIALRNIPPEAEWDILDLGTGCGAIALAVASERPRCSVTAVDVDPDALAVAAQNVRALELANVRCVAGDWAEPLAGHKFQLILSNPPYIAADDPALAALGAEPQLALQAGENGLAAIRRLAADCREVIGDDGWLMLEHGNRQRAQVAALLDAAGWRDIACHQDYAGHDRVSVARSPAGQS